MRTKTLQAWESNGDFTNMNCKTFNQKFCDLVRRLLGRPGLSLIKNVLFCLKVLTTEIILM